MELRMFDGIDCASFATAVVTLVISPIILLFLGAIGCCGVWWNHISRSSKMARQRSQGLPTDSVERSHASMFDDEPMATSDEPSSAYHDSGSSGMWCHRSEQRDPCCRVSEWRCCCRNRKLSYSSAILFFSWLVPT
jgi:hypothetical protein